MSAKCDGINARGAPIFLLACAVRTFITIPFIPTKLLSWIVAHKKTCDLSLSPSLAPRICIACIVCKYVSECDVVIYSCFGDCKLIWKLTDDYYQKKHMQNLLWWPPKHRSFLFFYCYCSSSLGFAVVHKLCIFLFVVLASVLHSIFVNISY